MINNAFWCKIKKKKEKSEVRIPAGCTDCVTVDDMEINRRRSRPQVILHLCPWEKEEIYFFILHSS